MGLTRRQPTKLGLLLKLSPKYSRLFSEKILKIWLLRCCVSIGYRRWKDFVSLKRDVLSIFVVACELWMWLLWLSLCYDTQEVYRTQFFSMFYFSINCGALLAKIIMPIFRADLRCYPGYEGPKFEECYSLAFGIPGLLMILATGRWFQPVDENRLPPGFQI